VRHKRFVIGAVVIVAALVYLIYSGMQQAMVYFVTPSELKSHRPQTGKFLRVGGLVVNGSLARDQTRLIYRFQLTDGAVIIPVFFKGVPPDLFTEGKGAVVEGRLGKDGIFQATTIMAKHAEEYSPHPDGKDAAKSFIPAKEAYSK